MNAETVFAAIKNTVLSYLPDAQILLFGSRARADFNEHSDYDILIITKETFAAKEKLNMESKISKSLVFLLGAPFDVILYSRNEFRLKKNVKGFILYHALKDSVEL